jgi:Ca2+-binding RTX toxin-like protein
LTDSRLDMQVEVQTSPQLDTQQLDAQYEQLSKILSSYFNPDSRALATQIFDTLGYVPSREFVDPTNEFEALGLVSKDGTKPPVLVLPGGRIGNPISAGNQEFADNRQAILDWLLSVTNDTQSNPQGLKPDVTGASRGGALTQLVASNFPTLIGSAVSFVSTAIDQETAEQFIENGGDPSQVRHYITDGDWRSLVGDTFIPGTVTIATYNAPLVSADGRVDYATRKHGSGILADFSELLPNDPAYAVFRAITDKPADQTLRQISVEELSQSDFTFTGQDWQAIVAKVAVTNPNLLAFTTREGAEEVRDHIGVTQTTPIFGFFEEALNSDTPLPPERLNQATIQNDLIFASDCSDTVDGSSGDDYIRGNFGSDYLYGNTGNDALIGGAGNDTLSGGLDSDVMTGGDGHDLFLFGELNNVVLPQGATEASAGETRVNDFNPSEDLIGLSKDVFTALTTDITSIFSTVTDDAAAELSTASLVYNTTNGYLFYNPNGVDTGFGDGGKFALIFGQPTLNAESFTVV